MECRDPVGVDPGRQGVELRQCDRVHDHDLFVEPAAKQFDNMCIWRPENMTLRAGYSDRLKMINLLVSLNCGMDEAGVLLGLDAAAVDRVPGEHLAVLRRGHDVVGVGAGRRLRDALHGGRVAHEHVSWRELPVAISRSQVDLPQDDLTVGGSRDESPLVAHQVDGRNAMRRGLGSPHHHGYDQAATSASAAAPIRASSSSARHFVCLSFLDQLLNE